MVPEKEIQKMLPIILNKPHAKIKIRFYICHISEDEPEASKLLLKENNPLTKKMIYKFSKDSNKIGLKSLRE